MRTARLITATFGLAAWLSSGTLVSASSAQALVYMPSCSGSEKVPAGSTVAVQTAWLAKTRAEVGEYKKALKLTLTINGVAIANPASYWDDLYYSANDGGWEARWDYRAGKITRGQAWALEMTWTLTKGVSDGWQRYPKGTSTVDCTLLGS